MTLFKCSACGSVHVIGGISMFRRLKNFKTSIEQWLADRCEGFMFRAQDRGDLAAASKWHRRGAWFIECERKAG